MKYDPRPLATVRKEKIHPHRLSPEPPVEKEPVQEGRQPGMGRNQAPKAGKA